MEQKYMMDVKDVIKELGVSKSKAYQILRQLNEELLSRDISKSPGSAQESILRRDTTDILSEPGKKMESDTLRNELREFQKRRL